MNFTFDGTTAAFVLAGVVLSVLVGLWHRDPNRPFDLTDLITENGKVSKLAVTWLGSFVVMSYGFTYAVLHATLTDTYAALYAATWVAPIIARMVKS